MITVRCDSCKRGRVALYNPDTPAIWFTRGRRKRTRSGSVNGRRRQQSSIGSVDFDHREAKTIVFLQDGSVLIATGRDQPYTLPGLTYEHIVEISDSFNTAWCQSCPTVYPTALVLQRAKLASRGSASAILMPAGTGKDVESWLAEREPIRSQRAAEWRDRRRRRLVALIASRRRVALMIAHIEDCDSLFAENLRLAQSLLDYTRRDELIQSHPAEQMPAHPA